MMWFFGLLYIFGAAFASAPQSEAVVLVMQGRAVCAGSFIDDKGLIVTAYHCVAAGGRPGIQTQDGRKAVGKVVATLPGADLAIIQCPALAGGPFFPIAGETPEQGEKIWVVGHPFGVRPGSGFLAGTLRWSTSEGVVSVVGGRALQISAPLNPGNSGGPVLNEEGELVGVVSRRLAGEGVGFATRSASVQALMSHQRPFGPWGGTIAAETYAGFWAGRWGVPFAGGRLEFSFRDRVVISLGGAFAPSARWTALQQGQAIWPVGEARLGFRQRVLRGYWSGRLDLYGGLAAEQEVSINWRNGGDGFTINRDFLFRPMVGGAMTFGDFGVDFALINQGEFWTARTAFIVRWPGGFRVF